MKQLFFIGAAVFVLASCSGDEPTVLGNWKNDKVELVVSEDGKLEFSTKRRKETASWKVEGDKFVVTVPGSEEHETVQIGVDPSTVGRGRKLLREEVGSLGGNAVPSGDPEIDRGTGDVVLHLYFQGNPKVTPCEYALSKSGEEPRLSLHCGFPLEGEFTR